MYYNTKYIDYGDYIHLQYYLKPIQRAEIREDIQDEIDKFDNNAIIEDLHDPIIIDDNKDPDKERHNLIVSQNRSKNNLFRIARSNNWDLFITITFDRNKVDSSDYNLVSKKMTIFLNNLRRSSPDLKYIIVPELHKDKKHYHFHGLLSNADGLILEDSGKVDKLGSKIYNIINWKFGFTTATYVKDPQAVRNYIGKYITKDLMNNLKYKKRYYASKNVNICKEEFDNLSIESIYKKYGDNIVKLKTQNIDGIQRITYMEIKK